MTDRAVIDEKEKEWANVYAVLGVHRGSTIEEVRLAWQRIAAQYHPDRTADPDKHALFVDAQYAWRILRSEQQQRLYLERTKLLNVPCTTCGATGTKAKSRSWASATLTACRDCEGCGYRSKT